MARMYSRKKGNHGSKKPPMKIVPKWVKQKGPEIEDIVVSLAKDRKSSSMIGTILRDQYGIPDSRLVTKKSVTEIMREAKAYPEMPEDLMSLFKKAVMLREHMKKSKKDKKAAVGLQHLESKIRRLVKYYSREGLVPKDFQYDHEKAKLIIQK
jgi:small subunit ribosomal protein S15